VQRPRGPVALAREHGEGREAEERRQRVREEHGPVWEQQRPGPERDGGRRAVARLDPLGQLRDQQQQEHRRQDRPDEPEGPEHAGGVARRPDACAFEHDVRGQRRQRETGRLVRVDVTVDLGDVVRDDVADLEPRLVDPRRPLRERAHERVVGVLPGSVAVREPGVRPREAEDGHDAQATRHGS
jgi:hypothetical protein